MLHLDVVHCEFRFAIGARGNTTRLGTLLMVMAMCDKCSFYVRVCVTPIVLACILGCGNGAVVHV